MALKQVIVVRKDLGMSEGKLAAQACHASTEALMRAQSVDKIMKSKHVDEWKAEGAKKIVVACDSEKEILALRDQAVRQGLRNALIKDAGMTELAPGTITALGIGPNDEKKIDRVTGGLRAL